MNYLYLESVMRKRKGTKLKAKEPFLLTPQNMALCTDLYELTMSAAYFDNHIDATATFELFVRSMPPRRSFLLAAGLEQVVEYLRNMRFTEDALDYLRSLDVFKHVSDDFFDYLSRFSFTGDLYAVPEGTVVFAQEPILRITAPIIEAQLIETYLLSTINFQTLIASKAARVVLAARGRAVVDFGSRRAHSPLAALWAARASYIAGCVATSNVLAGKMLGIPVMGTAAHSWTMAFESEVESFKAFQRVFPDHTILLIDTYDTIEGAKNAASLGRGVRGVRLDSGDLIALSKKVRKILDGAGLKDTKIVASGDLNEYRIAALLSKGAPIDSFGVGTEMVTSRDAPALGGVYKLVEQTIAGRRQPKVKRSKRKRTYPCAKQIFRHIGKNGKFIRDTIGLADESLSGERLIVPVIKNGRLLKPLPEINQLRERAMSQLASLPEKYKKLQRPDRYPVRISKALEQLRRSIVAKTM